MPYCNGVPDVKNDSKDVHSKNAAAEVPPDTKQPDRDLADNSNRSISTPPPTFSDDEGHESYDFSDWWAKDTYNRSGVEQISEVVNFLSILKHTLLLENSGLMLIIILGLYFFL